MSAFHNNALLGASGQQGYTISRSVRFRSSASAYFNRTPASASNRKTWTWSGWVKRGAIGSSTQGIFGVDGSNYVFLLFNNSGSNNEFDCGETISGVQQWRKQTSQVFRDPSSWYHIILAFDSTQATASNRVKLYVNGLQVTSFATSADPSLNFDSLVNSTAAHSLGRCSLPSTFYFDGYLTEVNFIDGQALTPSSFGENDTITGVWKPKKYAGTYGTNGFYLNFSDNSAATAAAIGKDYSGNGNNWTPNNISVTSGATYDSMLDVPTLYADGGNGRGNYAVLNPLQNGAGTLSGANLNLLGATTAWGSRLATIAVTSGKWYFEVTPTSGSATQGVMFGITQTAAQTLYIGSDANGFSYYGFNGQKYTNNAGSAYGATVADNDVVGVAFDADAGSITFYKNGTSQGVAFSGLSAGTWYLGVSCYGTATASANFGQRPFSYTPPSGFKALNTQNLPEPTIKKGNQYFDVSTWTGNGSNPRAVVTGLAFQPDLVWAKTRNQVRNHVLFDSVRGAGSTKGLFSNATDAEGGGAGNETSNYGYISSFNTDGFTVTNGAINNNYFNTNSDTYVGWQWQAGQGTTSSNANGSITSTVSVNTTAGFSVVSFTGVPVNTSTSTIGHGLGVAPSFIILKNRNVVDDWYCQHVSLGASARISLNTTAAAVTSTGSWGNTAPTSTVFTIANNAFTTSTSQNLIAYCFSAVRGYSAFGSYTGNGSADGPFIYCGFRPRFIMFKITSATGNWFIRDTSRDAYNTSTLSLYPNLSDAEFSGAAIDVLSNGFKLRASTSGANGSGESIIFAAFAENPFKNSLAR